MSIITDALNRLQAERPRRPDQPRSSATPDSAEVDEFHDSDFSPPHPPAETHRNRLPFLIVVLGGIGIAAYLWGMPLIAAPDKVTPEPEPRSVKVLNPVQSVPSQSAEVVSEQREEPFTTKVAKANEDINPRETVSTPDPPATTNPVTGGVPARKPRFSSGVRSTAKPPPARNVDSPSSNERKNRFSSLCRRPLGCRPGCCPHALQ